MHTHTTFCDGKDDVEAMCLAAYEKKLHAIGFSAHVPMSKQTGFFCDWTMKDEDVGEYSRHVQEAKERWKGKLDVYLGFEIDYVKGIRTQFDNDIKIVNPDYLIGSVHFAVPANGTRIFAVDSPLEDFEKGLQEGFNNDGEALMHNYYDILAEMISLGGFEILGHADIVKKNCMGRCLWPAESEAARQREIACAAKKAGIAIEINTGGINRKKINDLYPSASFLQILHEYDVPVIITADAHCAADIAGSYDIAVQKLKQIGFMKHAVPYVKNKKIILQNETL